MCTLCQGHVNKNYCRYRSQIAVSIRQAITLSPFRIMLLIMAALYAIMVWLSSRTIHSAISETESSVLDFLDQIRRSSSKIIKPLTLVMMTIPSLRLTSFPMVSFMTSLIMTGAKEHQSATLNSKIDNCLDRKSDLKIIESLFSLFYSLTI